MAEVKAIRQIHLKEWEDIDNYPDETIEQLSLEGLQMAYLVAGNDEEAVKAQIRQDESIQTEADKTAISMDEFIRAKRIWLEAGPNNEIHQQAAAGVMPAPAPHAPSLSSVPVRKNVSQLNNLIKMEDPDARPEIDSMDGLDPVILDLKLFEKPASYRLHAPDEFFSDRSLLLSSAAVRGVNSYLNAYRLAANTQIYSTHDLKHVFCNEMAEYTAQAHSQRIDDSYHCFIYFVEGKIFLAAMFERVPAAESPDAPRDAFSHRRYRWAGHRYMNARPKATASGGGGNGHKSARAI